jgi:hypothetical protein
MGNVFDFGITIVVEEILKMHEIRLAFIMLVWIDIIHTWPLIMYLRKCKTILKPVHVFVVIILLGESELGAATMGLLPV